MNQGQIALQYRELAVKSATQVGLVVLLYDMAIESLTRAAREIDAGNVEARTTEINHVLAIVAELQRSLNFERGGDVARRLEDFYDVARGKLLEANIKSDKEIVERLFRIFCSIREAWQVVDREAGSDPGAFEAAPSTPPVPRPASPQADAEPESAHWSA